MPPCESRLRRSFNHLVGAGEQRRWHLDAERLGGFEVDHELEFGRLLHRQIGGLRAFENPPSVNAGETMGSTTCAQAIHGAMGKWTIEIEPGSIRLRNAQSGETLRFQRASG